MYLYYSAFAAAAQRRRDAAENALLIFLARTGRPVFRQAGLFLGQRFKFAGHIGICL